MLGVWILASIRSAAFGYNQTMSDTNIDIDNLDAEERLQLIERLWDSLEDSPDTLPLSAAQKRELDSRLDRIDAGDDAGIPWGDMMAQIQAKLDLG